MSRARIAAFLAVTALTFSVTLSEAASANFHLVKVREVHRGPSFTGDYVMLQMYAAGQNFFGTHHVRILDATGIVNADYELRNVPSGQNQRTYLLGNTGVAGADQNEAGVLIGESGAACFNELGLGTGGIDCVSWGGFQPSGGGESPSSLAGNPAVPGGLGTDQSLVRTITRGCATALDPADDTDNSAGDFAAGAPIGRPNAVAPTEKLCDSAQAKKKKKKKCKKARKKAKKGDATAAAKKCKKKKKEK